MEVDEVTYFHVELPRHDLILAEGLPTESYLGDRTDFEAMRLLGRRQSVRDHMWAAFGCAPLIVCGPELEAVRRHLASVTRRTRAARSSTSQEPGLPARGRRTACFALSHAAPRQ